MRFLPIYKQVQIIMFLRRERRSPSFISQSNPSEGIAIPSETNYPETHFLLDFAADCTYHTIKTPPVRYVTMPNNLQFMRLQ